MSEPTKEIVQAFWKAGCEKFDAKIVDKDDSALMKLVADFLDMMGIMDDKKFMENYTTTVGSTIYPAFDVGEPKGGWSLIWQMTTLVHELKHVVQYQQDPILFPGKYACSRSNRAHYECQAFETDMQLWYWLKNTGYDIKGRAGSLYGYNLKKVHVEYAEMYLNTINDIVQQDPDALTCPVVDWAVGWLEENAPELKA